MRESIAKEKERNMDRSNRKRPQPLVEVQLGPLGTDKGFEHEGYVHRKDKEGLLGGDEDYIGSSDIDSFDSDSEDEDGPKRRRNRTVHYDPKVEQHVFELGMVFKSVYEFRDAIDNYSLRRGAKLRVIPNEYDRVRARCKGKKGCPWHLYGSLNKRTNNFMVKTYILTHTCSKTNRNKHCHSKFIYIFFKEKIMDNPNIKIWRLKELVKEKLEVYVGRTVYRRAKFKVIQQCMGDFKDEFMRIYDYRYEILRSNPGSTCEVFVDQEDIPIQCIFRGFYVCFKAMKDGFKEGIRRCIGVDGCFLKGVYKGQVLSCIAKDGNSQMYPIAWAVVGSETKYTWKWFIQLLQQDLELSDGAGFVVISDIQKGLILTIKEVLPEAKHRMCARHVLANWEKEWRGVERRNLFWRVCKSTFEAQLKDNLKELEKLGSKKIITDLMNYHIDKFCRVYFTLGNSCDVVDNNMVESFNASILAARHKTIITMLEEIRIKYMQRHIQMREFVQNKWTCDISLMALDTLASNSSASMRCKIEWNGDAGYEVIEGDYRHVVDTRKETCTCRSWGLKGIPCQYAIAALHKEGKDPVDKVSEWHGREKYNKAYGYYIQPLMNMKMWLEKGYPLVEPPKLKPMPGRPQKNRRRARDEVKKIGKYLKKGLVMTCSHCKQKGHNKKGCAVLKQLGNPGSSSTQYENPGSSSTQATGTQPSAPQDTELVYNADVVYKRQNRPQVHGKQ